MFKRKSRSNWARDKFGKSERFVAMTVRQRNDDTQESSFPVVSPCGKNHWPEMENDNSSSWDRNSRATSSSWPGDMEEAATRKVLQLWDVIERNLFGESNDSNVERLSDECEQWKTQLTHLRIIGKSVMASQNSNNESIRSSSVKSNGENRANEETMMENILDKNKSQSSNENAKFPYFAEDQSEVFDRIFDFVCAEISKPGEEKETTELMNDLDDVLRITRAPTYSGGKITKGRKKRDSGGSGKSSGRENRASAVADGTGDVLGQNSRTISARSRRTSGNSVEGDDNDDTGEDESTPVPRNKLGTVFNEKIIVSPVPYVLSQRESFTTLRNTPISFRAQIFENPTPQGLGRYLNSASRTNSGQRISGFRISQSHSAWQVPVCPTVWPKNIRLAPIDPARLPSSKNRSSSDSPALPQRNRNSLSPISRPPRAVPSASLREHNGEGLEIQGKQIVTRSRKQNLPKTGSPRNAKSSRTKTRPQKR